MRILFLCKYNRFRSKVAEAIFNALNKDKRIKAESAGVFLDEARPYISRIVVRLLKEKGYDAKGTPGKVTEKMLKDADRIFLVASNVDINLFSKYRDKIKVWPIKDWDENSDENDVLNSINEIELRVKKLIKNI